MDDGELIAGTARGDADAFAVFYRRHLPRVVGFALRATGDPEVAADLAAEVFAAALESSARYEHRHASAAPWLLGIRAEQAARKPAAGTGRERDAQAPSDGCAPARRR